MSKRSCGPAQEHTQEHAQEERDFVLPSEERVTLNLKQWKLNLASLSEVVAKVEQATEQRNRKDENIRTMNDMFERYVLPKYPSKKFDGNFVKALKGYGSEKTITYQYDGVELYYFGRQTYCIDDYDYFVDKTVTVDGVCILNQIKQ
jgi:hypothetical protein